MIRRSVIGGLTLALALGACGDDTPSHAEFAAQVQTICERAGRQHAAASEGFDFASFDPETSDLAPLVPIVERNVAIGREAADDIDALDGPEEDVAKADAWVALATRLHDLGDEQAAALRAGDRAAFVRLAEQEDALHEEPTDDLFADCG